MERSSAPYCTSAPISWNQMKKMIIMSICSSAIFVGLFRKDASMDGKFSYFGIIYFIGSSLTDDPLKPLQHLRSLMEVYPSQANQGESTCFQPGGFLKLRKLFLTKVKGLRRARVEEVAMPDIRQLFLYENLHSSKAYQMILNLYASRAGFVRCQLRTHKKARE